MRVPNPSQAAHHIGRLREARAIALQDAEGFHPLFQAFESLGHFLNVRKMNGLGRYKEILREFVASQAVEETVLNRFEFLFSIVLRSRNAAVHEGTYARTLTQHATDFALVLELALMNMLETAEHYMISQPVTIAPWQTLREARQLMLRNSFSFLPIKVSEGWRVLADFEIVNYLKQHKNSTGKVSDVVFDNSLENAITTNGRIASLKVHVVVEVTPETPVQDLPHTQGPPILVVRDKELVGIITPFDLL